jgi:hypothetical protein
MAVNQLIRSAVECEHPAPRLAYMAPLYKQAKAIAWDYMRRFAGPIDGAKFNESELRCDLPGERRITLLGADNPDALRGIYLDGIVLDEYALMTEQVWTAVIRPTLVDRQGFAIFMGTPLGRNHFHALYERACQREDVLTMLYRASETAIVPADELDRAREEMGPDLYAQEFECSFEAAITGAYYARQLEQVRAESRIRTVPWQPAVPVITAWDLGRTDSTAIVFAQRARDEVHVIDFLEADGQELAFYVRELQRRPYLYGEHILPHDANAETLAAGGRSIATQLRAMFRTLNMPDRCRVLPQDEIAPGIELARRVFPRCWFDESKTRALIDHLASYRRAWSKIRNAYADDPQHDEHSHAADAFRYLAVGLREERTGPVQTHATTGASDPWGLRQHTLGAHAISSTARRW